MTITILLFSHILLCNILSTILRPNFEDFLDTAKQLEEQKITLYVPPGGEMWKQFLLNSSTDEYISLGENMIIADSWGHFWNLSKYDALGAGTHVRLGVFPYPYEVSLGKKYHPDGRGWYISQEHLASKFPYTGYLTNKKWHLNEVNELRCFFPYHLTFNIFFHCSTSYNILRIWLNIYFTSNKYVCRNKDY